MSAEKPPEDMFKILEIEIIKKPHYTVIQIKSFKYCFSKHQKKSQAEFPIYSFINTLVTVYN